jgi:hypothetical protein
MLNGEQLARMAQRWRMNKPLTMTIPCQKNINFIFANAN